MGLQLAIEEVAARPPRADDQQIVVAGGGRGFGRIGGRVIHFHCGVFILQQVQDERNRPQRSGGGVRRARFGGQNGIAPGLLGGGRQPAAAAGMGRGQGTRRR